MADTKISGLAALGATPADGDLIPIVDVSDTSMAATGTDKKVTRSELVKRIDNPQFNEAVNMTATSSELNITDGGNTTEKVLNVQSKARAYRGNNQNIASGTAVKVLFDTETYDVGGDFDLANSKFVTPVAGYYLITGTILIDDLNDGDRCVAYIYINGLAVAQGRVSASSAAVAMGATVTDIRYVGAGIDIDLRGWHNEGATQILLGNSDYNFMAIHLLSV